MSDKDRQGWFVLSGVGSVLIVAFLFKVSHESRPKPGPDNCIGPVTRSTVVVLDHSEETSDQTQLEVTARVLQHILNKVEVNERVTVFHITEVSKRNLAPAFSACRPPSSGNRLIERVQTIEEHFDRQFVEPLTKSLQVRPTESAESPIAHAIIDISLSEYLRSDNNTLLIFSDLLENTQRFSLYGCTDDKGVVQRFRESRRGALERPSFKNTQIVLNIIPRFNIGRMSLACRDYFWNWFFGDSEGKGAGVMIQHLPGGPTK